MAVSGHRDEIAPFFGGRLENLRGWVSHAKAVLHRQASLSKGDGGGFEVASVSDDFLGLREFQGLKISRRPSISHMEQYQFGSQPTCELGNVRE